MNLKKNISKDTDSFKNDTDSNFDILKNETNSKLDILKNETNSKLDILKNETNLKIDILKNVTLNVEDEFNTKMNKTLLSIMQIGTYMLSYSQIAQKGKNIKWNSPFSNIMGITLNNDTFNINLRGTYMIKGIFSNIPNKNLECLLLLNSKNVENVKFILTTDGNFESTINMEYVFTVQDMKSIIQIQAQSDINENQMLFIIRLDALN